MSFIDGSVQTAIARGELSVSSIQEQPADWKGLVNFPFFFILSQCFFFKENFKRVKRLGIVKHVLPIHNIQIRCISYLRSWQKKRLFCWIIQKIRAIGRGGALCGVKWEALQVSRSIVSLNFTCFVFILRSGVSVVLFFFVVVVYDSRASLNYFGTVEPNLSIMHGCAAYNLLKINSFIIFFVAHFCVCVCVCEANLTLDRLGYYTQLYKAKTYAHARNFLIQCLTMMMPDTADIPAESSCSYVIRKGKTKREK